jgi:transposase
MSYPFSTFLGVDVAKLHLDLYDSATKKTWQISNDDDGFKSLVAYLKKQSTPSLVLCESSGPYHLSLVLALQKAGCPVSVLNPMRVRACAKAQGLLAKTDALDAKNIAAFGQLYHPEPTPPLSPVQHELVALIDQRSHLVDLATAEKSRLDQLLASSSKKSSQALLNYLEKQLKALTAKLDQLRKKDPELNRKVAVLTAVDGIAQLSALSILAHLPEIGSLSKTEIAALSGTAPINRDSGTLRGHRSIGGGRPKARKVMYMPALTAMKKNDLLREFYQKLVAKGKPKKLAIVAVMRKLLIYLNSLLKKLAATSPNLSVVTP